VSEQETVDWINAMLAEMPQEVAGHLVQQWHQEAARMATQADRAPPLMRGPEFPWGLKGFNAQTARFACRQPGCTMVHLEFMDELPGPFRLPVNFTAEDVSAAISAQASERHQARMDRLTAVFREHYRTEHPEALEEIHGTPAPAAR
jgi:hypothetical protein